MHPIREILNGCADIVDQRGQPYGGIEYSFADAAAIASILTRKALDARDIALVLHAVKLVRLAGNPAHDDSYDDGINYLAFAKMLRTPEAVAVKPEHPPIRVRIDGTNGLTPIAETDGAIADWSAFDSSIQPAKASA